MGKITLFSKLKELGCLFFVSISPFSNPLSPFKTVSNISNNWLPQILALMVPKWVQLSYFLPKIWGDQLLEMFETGLNGLAELENGGRIFFHFGREKNS